MSKTKKAIKKVKKWVDQHAPEGKGRKRTFGTRCAEMRIAAREAAKVADTWIDVHNVLFGVGGRCTQLFPSEAERLAFIESDEYKEVREIIEKLRDEKGDPPAEPFESAERANGKILVRVPKALHAALVVEAKDEGVSLNQLILSKLAVQLRAVV